MYNISITKS